MPVFPLCDRVYYGDEPLVIEFYDKDGLTTHFIYGTFNSLLTWIGKFNSDDDLTVYIRSEDGLRRSVYAANKLGELLISQGHDVTIRHVELSRTKK